MSVEVRITKDFGAFKLDIDFKSESKRIGILGASGCGKSLTLKSIAGIEKPDKGRIAVGERTLYDSSKRIILTPKERRCGYLFQNYALFPTMTVAKNIGIGLKCGKTEREERVRNIMKRFGLEGLEKRFPGELSGGQQQRAALARIMVYEPDVILLDEPFSALDVYLKDKMQRECMELLKDYPGIVILVSHSRDEIYRFSEEAMVIDKGRIIVHKPTKELFANPETVEAARLTGCKNILEVIGEDGRKKIIGIRAHEFETVKPLSSDYFTFKVLEPRVTEDLFEYNITFRPAEESEHMLDWKISKYQWDMEHEGMPKEIYVRKEKILLLEQAYFL